MSARMFFFPLFQLLSCLVRDMAYPREESSQAHLLLEQLGLEEGEGQPVYEGEGQRVPDDASALSAAWWRGGVWGGVQLGDQQIPEKNSQRRKWLHVIETRAVGRWQRRQSLPFHLPRRHRTCGLRHRRGSAVVCWGRLGGVCKPCENPAGGASVKGMSEFETLETWADHDDEP
jgi:hypothetical protein